MNAMEIFGKIPGTKIKPSGSDIVQEFSKNKSLFAPLKVIENLVKLIKTADKLNSTNEQTSGGSPPTKSKLPATRYIDREPDSIFTKEYRMNGKLVSSDSNYNSETNKTVVNPNKKNGGSND